MAKKMQSDETRLRARVRELEAALKSALCSLEIDQKIRMPEWDGEATPFSTIGMIRNVLAAREAIP